ncbi:MAG: diguanylate cyclase [Desulfobacterales bacterium]|nr:diguanylate cyclase [Desulfobacterales bacterium]
MADIQAELNYEKEVGVPFTDTLTGLFNNGFFQIALEREISRAKRYGGNFTLFMIDIDSFCYYNRRYGPLKGDLTLKEIANVINANIRNVDLAARYSGDVFAVILTESELSTSLRAAERIRCSVEESDRSNLTVSIGLAAYPIHGENKEKLIQRAQDALCMAKLKGKNSVYFFENEIKYADSSRSKVLIVDDEPLNLKLLEAFLIPLEFEVIKATNGEDALALVSKVDVDLVLLDIMMPGMDGFEVCRRIKQKETTRMIPVILVTALNDTDAKVEGIKAGADDFITKPPNKMELIARTNSLINLKKLNNSLTSFENVIFSLAQAVEAKDSYTKGHIERVKNLAIMLGWKMGLSPKEIEALKFGGALHDIGKIGVPGEILNKPGPLNRQEWEIMQAHPYIGYKICLPLQKNLGIALDIIRHHHEKLDGSGYPDGLTANEISMVARIMSVADIYDALITDRPYRKGMNQKNAFKILSQEAEQGKLDKKVVKYLLESRFSE